MLSQIHVQEAVAYLGFWKGGQELSAEGAGVEGHWGWDCAPSPENFSNFLNENGVFWFTPEHRFKVNVPATKGLASDAHALCL